MICLCLDARQWKSYNKFENSLPSNEGGYDSLDSRSECDDFLPHTPPPPTNGRRQKPPSHTGSGRAPAPDPKLGTDPGDLRLRDLITYFKHAPTPPTSPGSRRRWCKHFGQLKVTFQSIVLFCFAKKFLLDCL